MHHRGSPSSESLAFGDSDEVEPGTLYPEQASVDVVQIQHVDAGMALDVTDDSDFQVRRERRYLRRR
jgi:hypothetical protein